MFDLQSPCDGIQFRAHVELDYARYDRIAVHLIGRRAGRAGDITCLVLPCDIVMEEVDVTAPPSREPFLRIPDAMGRALLDALAAHYGGTTDVRTLRGDYDAERKRVDQLIGTLSVVATTGAAAADG